MDFQIYFMLFGIFMSWCVSCVQIINFDDLHSLDSKPSTIANLNTSQFITMRGFNSETHTVITSDGYVLSIYRIPSRGPPVLLAHGIADSSDSWVILNPNASLAFSLAKKGYDVWIYNARGNKYSKRHTKKIPSKQYWDFSYEEMGVKDLPATIDYILSNTLSIKLTYVGYSQGTTIFFVMCSMRAEYNEKIKHAVLLAPVAWTGYLKYPLMNFWSKNINTIATLAEAVGLYEVFPDSPTFNRLHAEICRFDSLLIFICQLRYYFILGLENIMRLSPDSSPLVASHIPAGTSAKTFVHYIKGAQNKKFQRFDYGSEKNLIVYNSIAPPQYNLSLVSVPITIMASEVDWFSDPTDVKMLRKSLPNLVKYIMFNESVGFTHMEFVYANIAKDLVNNPILAILSKEYGE